MTQKQAELKAIRGALQRVEKSVEHAILEVFREVVLGLRKIARDGGGLRDHRLGSFIWY